MANSTVINVQISGSARSDLPLATTSLKSSTSNLILLPRSQAQKVLERPSKRLAKIHFQLSGARLSSTSYQAGTKLVTGSYAGYLLVYFVAHTLANNGT